MNITFNFNFIKLKILRIVYFFFVIYAFVCCSPISYKKICAYFVAPNKFLYVHCFRLNNTWFPLLMKKETPIACHFSDLITFTSKNISIIRGFEINLYQAIFFYTIYLHYENPIWWYFIITIWSILIKPIKLVKIIKLLHSVNACVQVRNSLVFFFKLSSFLFTLVVSFFHKLL